MARSWLYNYLAVLLKVLFLVCHRDTIGIRVSFSTWLLLIVLYLTNTNMIPNIYFLVTCIRFLFAFMTGGGLSDD